MYHREVTPPIQECPEETYHRIGERNGGGARPDLRFWVGRGWLQYFELWPSILPQVLHLDRILGPTENMPQWGGEGEGGRDKRQRACEEFTTGETTLYRINFCKEQYMPSW